MKKFSSKLKQKLIIFLKIIPKTLNLLISYQELFNITYEFSKSHPRSESPQKGTSIHFVHFIYSNAKYVKNIMKHLFNLLYSPITKSTIQNTFSYRNHSKYLCMIDMLITKKNQQRYFIDRFTLFYQVRRIEF